MSIQSHASHPSHHAPLLYPCTRYPNCLWGLYASPPPVAVAVVGLFLLSSFFPGRKKCTQVPSKKQFTQVAPTKSTPPLFFFPYVGYIKKKVYGLHFFFTRGLHRKKYVGYAFFHVRVTFSTHLAPTQHGSASQ